MKYIEEDIKMYIAEKEYIDTAIIPLVPYAIDDDQEMILTSFQQELMTLYSHQLEQRLKGRLFLFPVYTYLNNSLIENEIDRINQLIDEVKKQPFNEVFLLTFDKQWRKHGTSLKGELVWLPAIKNGNLQSNEVREVIQSQIIDIEELIKESWS
ncbi:MULTISPECIES: DUF2487 family protein [Allobacillus]|uniref:YpiF family protein n=1 Tax=Allobacillus halotolerans TaxID=570278 RepID=A0ABS6GM22_9BACI|nr:MULTISPECIES: DUF2487 family protein [Allobacillus]MBU6079508.1 YpiF family protein [Allobacillus halotolerans]TSJ69038.1 DUF2487 family protein [Allobacillus sp. SKP2-8]